MFLNYFMLFSFSVSVLLFYSVLIIIIILVVIFIFIVCSFVFPGLTISAKKHDKKLWKSSEEEEGGPKHTVHTVMKLLM